MIAKDEIAPPVLLTTAAYGRAVLPNSITSGTVMVPLLVSDFRLTFVEPQLDVSNVSEPLTVRPPPRAEKAPPTSIVSFSTEFVLFTEKSFNNTCAVVVIPPASTMSTWTAASTTFVARLVTVIEGSFGSGPMLVTTMPD